jgi:hypothetical protein
MHDSGVYGSSRGIAVAAFAVLTSALAACGGSSDADGTAPNTSSLVNEVCRHALEAPCGSATAEQDCLERLGQDHDDAVREGCGAELSAYLECASARPMECSAIDGEPLEPHVDSSCSEKRSALSECITGVPGYCGVGFGPGMGGVFCSVGCPEFSSNCTGPSQYGPLECTCETGPHAGLAFQATDCSRGITMATGHTCR